MRVVTITELYCDFEVMKLIVTQINSENGVPSQGLDLIFPKNISDQWGKYLYTDLLLDVKSNCGTGLAHLVIRRNHRIWWWVHLLEPGKTGRGRLPRCFRL